MKRREWLVGAGMVATGYAATALGTVGPPALESTDGTRELTFSENYPTRHREPDVELAKLWWPEQRNVWTPIGWKDHYFRFNVVYNGTILCEPCPHWTPPRPHAKRWLGQDFQLSFVPPSPRRTRTPVSRLPKETTQLWHLDGGHGIQGWDTDRETPVLWTEWRLQEGLIIRQEVFAHISGGGDVQSGIEPLYAWIRLSVTHVDELRAPDKLNFDVQLSRVCYEHDGSYLYEDGVALNLDPQLAAYPRLLQEKPVEHGMLILEPDGKVRMIVPAKTADKVKFSEPDIGSGIYALNIELAGIVGDHVDMLLPMLPEEEADITPELSVGFEGALAQSERYWSKRPTSAARVHVPEDYINRVINQSLKFAEVIAEKDYENGDFTFLSGSWAYDNLWSTPTSMISHMFLDHLGYHESVERHVELFRKHQGSVKPPGPLYDLHPGYFSTPSSLTAFNWLSDHGAILLTVAKHALLAESQRFVESWTDPIVRACDFIKDACAKTDHDGAKGLLPPAVIDDSLIVTQAVWSLGWNYKGLATGVEFLKRIGHPRAEEFGAFTIDQKAIFLKAFRERSAEGELWTDASGQKHRKTARTLSTKPMPPHPMLDEAYLDTGPMFLVWAGLVDANDELMRAAVNFFREGPNTKLYGYRPDPLDRPVLLHEIATCEPCYSWNVFHSWQLGDRYHFLEGLYSLFVGALSNQTYISCEHRHGIQGNLFATPTAFALARYSVIDDEVVSGELHVLRLCPLAWISSDQETVFEGMPTLYGRVDLRLRLSKDTKTLNVSFRGDWKEKPKSTILHSPPVPGLSNIVVNGRRKSVTKQIDIS